MPPHHSTERMNGEIQLLMLMLKLFEELGRRKGVVVVRVLSYDYPKLCS